MKRSCTSKRFAKGVLVGFISFMLGATALSSEALAQAKQAIASGAVSSATSIANGAISYDSATKTITIQGNCTNADIYAYMHGSGAATEATTLHFAATSVIQTLRLNPQEQWGAFQETKLERITADDNAWVLFRGENSTKAPTLAAFFYGCSALVSVDGLASWDISNVNTLQGMFGECSSLTSINGISLWNLKGLKGASWSLEMMFSDCSSLTSLDALSAWDVSGVSGSRCMDAMFSGCSGLTSLDGISAWDVSHVSGEHCMGGMFYGCTSLTSLDGLSSWNVSHVTGYWCMASMFRGCSSLTSLKGLSGWDVSNVQGDCCMMDMFEGCSSLKTLDGLATWNVGNMSVNGCMVELFANCTNLASIDALAHWQLNATDYEIGYMFYNCTSISSLTLSGGFRLSYNMSLPVNSYWWPVDDPTATSGISTVQLVEESQKDTPLSLRWQRCTTADTNPMTAVSNVIVNWSANADLTYTGLLQTLTPVVSADGNMLAEGTDYYITYTNQSTGEISEAMKNAGTYSAQIIVRGAYDYTGTPAATNVTIQPLALGRTTNPPEVYTVPAICDYTGNFIEPKTVVRLELNSSHTYTYLVSNTATNATTGDYNVTYNNNVNPGTATATISPASANLTGNSLSTTFEIAPVRSVSFDSNGGSAVATESIRVGRAAAKPQDPTKSGFVFAYWCSDEDLLEEYNFATPLSENVMLYAKWIAAPAPEPTPGTDADDGLIPMTGDILPSANNFAVLGLLILAMLGLSTTWYALKKR